MSTPNSSAPPAAAQPPAAKPAKKSLPFHYQFLAGGVAGTTEILVMYPLDVVKTRFQLQTAGTQQYTSVLDCFRQIVRQEGFGRLYRGIVPPIMMEAPKRATKFAANEQYTTLYKRWLLDGQEVSKASAGMKALFPVLTGVSAGCTEAFIVVPFDLVKIRLQDKNSASKYKNTIDCVRKIVVEEGPMAFFKGMESTLWRHGVWSGVYFGSIGWIKESPLMAMMKGADGKNEVTANFIAGVIGGTLGTLFNTPFDVVKTRVQNNVFSGWTLPGLFLG
jgi:solute carrier family 25 2-oxodicarboxylate transporter 21